MATVKTAMKKTAKKKAVVKKPARKKPSTAIGAGVIKNFATFKCKTLSGKSTLTYHYGTDGRGQYHVRIHGNTGGGYHSNEWVSLDAILAKLEQHPEDKPISSINLFDLFKGKSVNTPGYLLAVLINEGLLKPFQGKKRQYQFNQAAEEELLSKIDKLKQSK
jgi:hypothetical protein